MATLPEWSRKQNWRNWLTLMHTCCYICFHFGDSLGNPPDHGVLIAKGIGGFTEKESRDAFKSHVKTHHEPEWLNDRLDWSIKR